MPEPERRARAPAPLPGLRQPDGYGVAGDCDDRDPATHRGGAEIEADGVDEDCDGLEACYLDQDADGARGETLAYSDDVECSGDGVALVDAELDCDDTNPDVRPGSFGTYADWSGRHEALTTLSGPAGTVRIVDGTWGVPCPEGARTDYVDGEGTPRICTFGMGAGTVQLVADSSVFSDPVLALADNLALLEATFPVEEPVWIDPHLHGRVPAQPLEITGLLEALLAQGALLYVLVLWQRARPLGPARTALDEREPGMVRELRTLGKLHAAARHGVEATRRLLAQAPARFAGDERLAALPRPDEVETLAQALAAGAQLAALENPPRCPP